MPFPPRRHEFSWFTVQDADPDGGCPVLSKPEVEGHHLQGRFDYLFHDARLTATSFTVVECPYSDHALLSCTLTLKD